MTARSSSTSIWTSYLGKLDDEGFEVCHRLEAAEQIQAVAPGLVSEYIAQLTGMECNHVLLRKRITRP